MSRRLFALAFLAPSMVACSENEFHNVTGTDGVGPEIEVTPQSIDFGVLSDGEENIQQFTITSVGSADLSVERIQMDGASFTLLTETSEFVLPPGASMPIDVRFTPMGANEQSGHATVFSDDASNGAVEVDLVGVGAVPELEITPDPYDFGVEYIGCAGNGHEFTLTNVGTDDLVVDSLAYENNDGQLSMTDTNAWPMTLAPGAATTVWIDFVPSADSVSDGAIVATGNDPRGEVRATQTAEAMYVDVFKEDFEIPEEPPVDILFAVDQSCSMDDDITRLANQFSRFISDINDYTTGWRIGVATKDTGCFNEGILKSTTSGYESKFQSAVFGDGGSYTEALLTVASEALSRTGSGQCNDGFLRSSAMLHIILVSDEPEQSSRNWSTFISEYQGYKSDPSLVKVSAVAGDYPWGCSSAAAGTGYYEAVNATGGEFLSICSTDWATHVEKLATASIDGLYDFELSKTPDPSTIQVWVNGTEWTSGWSYDATTNEVQFDDKLGGGTVTVKYGVLGNCD